MKKQIDKQAKRASKLAKAENLKIKQQEIAAKTVMVKNAEGDPDTTAEIVVQNQINYIPKVSVIIPVYNVEQYLRECLDSVVNQTLKEIEIICVDDGSTDKSLDILKEYAKKDKRITVLKQQNLHAGVARNAGLAVAKGEYLSFLDSDDFFELEMLEKVYQEALRTLPDIVLYTFQTRDDKEDKTKIHCGRVNCLAEPSTKMENVTSDLHHKILQTSRREPWNKLYNREFVEREEIRFQNTKTGNDVFFYYLIMIMAQRFAFVDEDLMTYRVLRKTSLTSLRSKYPLICLDNYIKIKGALEKRNRWAEWQSDFCNFVKSSLTWTAAQQPSQHAFYDEILKNLRLRDLELYSLLEDFLQQKRQYYKLIEAKNSAGDPDITAEIVVQNKINYIPKVSVITPVYNVEEYLRESLDSITNQTLKEIEIICVDDGSTDKSLDILKEYAARDKRITVLKQQNAGSGPARNNGILTARGEFVAFMDSDDMYPSEKTLEHMYQAARKNDALICGGSLHKLTNGKIITDPAQFAPEHTFNHNGFINYKDYQFDYGYWRFIYNRKFLRGNQLYFPDYLRCQDPPFFVKTMAVAERFFAIKEATYLYRISHKKTQWTERKIIDVYKARMDLLAICEMYELNKTYEIVAERLTSGELIHKIDDLIRNDNVNNIIRKALNSIDESKIDNKHIIENKNNILNELEVKAAVSVIIPIYNVEEYLRECLDSVINQTLHDIEIICVNDGSPDNSLAILKEYAAKDSRIVIVDQENQGLSCSRNNALKIAKGEYILFLDSDDWLKLDACEVLYKKSKEYKLDMLNFAGTNYDDASKIYTQTSSQNISYVGEDKEYFSRKELETFMYKISISACRFFYRRTFLKNNNITFPEGINFEDNYFVRKALIFAQRYGIEKEILYFRRVHEGSITQCQNKFFNDYIEVVKRVDELYAKHNINKDINKKIIQSYCNILYNQYLKFRKEDKIKYNKELFSFYENMQKRHHFYDERFSENYNPYKKGLEQWWYRRNHTSLNLNHPKTFNEKIQWLKLYNSTPIKTRLADKYLVRDWIKEKIGEDYLIPLLGVYDKFEDIDFDKLPDKFVIKCNHGSGWNIIVKDKSQLDLAEVKEKLDKWMNTNFAFSAGCELHYRDILPKILIERYVSNDDKNLYDYKFWCFNGEVKYMQFRDDFSENLKMVFYDMHWRKQPFYYSHPLYDKDLEKPDNFDEMIKIAKKLCQGFSFVCVDLYHLNNGDIKFGEMTFTRSSGLGRWNDEKYNRMMGNLIKLPKLAYNIDTGKYYRLPRPSKIKSYLLFPYYLIATRLLRKKKEKLQGYRLTVLNDLPTIESNCYIPLGTNCRVAEQFRANGIRQMSLPFDWLAGFSLNFVVSTIKKGINSWFEEYIEVPSKSNQKDRCIYDLKNKFRSKHIFPLNKTMEEYMSTFRKTYTRRCIRLKQLLDEAENICFVCNNRHEPIADFAVEGIISPNKKDTITDFIEFLKKLRAIYPHKKWTLLHIEHSDSGREILQYQVGEDITVYNVKIYDMREKEPDGKFKFSWKGNTKTWKEICSHLKLKSINAESVMDIHKNKKSAFRNFLCHQIKTDSYTKTYICGIRVRKKPANIYSFIDNRLAQIASAQKQKLNALAQTVEMQEKSVADKINMAFAEQQLLFEQITSLQNECNKKFECLSSWIENENISIKSIAQKITAQEKILNDFSLQSQANYQELNYADLLHDSINGCNWLKDKSFSLFGWAANYSFIYILYRILDQVHPMNILEMGLGQTTKLTSQYIAYKNPQAELDVCEHNQDWIDIYSPDLPKAENIRINYFGLENFEYEGQKNDKYSGLLPFVGKRRFDLIIVDGPIGEGRNLPRSNILDLIANGNLTDNFIIIFDDAGREGEKTTIAKTKELLQKQNIEYCSFERKGIKRQCIITGGVYSFAQYL